MLPGDRVCLKAYGDEIIQRRVVDVAGQHIFICTDEEYAAAEQEGREPTVSGFSVRDIVTAH